MFEYARFAPATGAGDGTAWFCCAAAFALRRAISILRICSGVGGFGGNFPAERVARGGVRGLSAMLKCTYVSVMSVKQFWRLMETKSSQVRLEVCQARGGGDMSVRR